ncbi:putative 4-coumarate--CoA ligase 2 [Fragariocoptes setiger]|uniref:4-coumarate--CoA ligase 2 n=1 Tax=Fragariocoptes setiger TaxID=1670756 RepID=A0ABQ7S7J6_9ACAR|nr:putative 4-coumarate--CoA ligase 2 [Fragariocoptes setiger]
MVFKSVCEGFTLPEEKQSMARLYFDALDRHASRRLLVDAPSGRTWTGAQIKQQVIPIATALIAEHNLTTGDIVGLLYLHSDRAVIFSLAVTIAGGVVCCNDMSDPYDEYRHSYSCVRPKFIATSGAPAMRLNVARLCADLQLDGTTLMYLDETNGSINDVTPPSHANRSSNTNGNSNNSNDGTNSHIVRKVTTYDELLQFKVDHSLHSCLLPASIKHPATELAYILFTSGSTGLPKPVGRSHKNSAYVSHTLDHCPQLWHLTPTSVLAGQLPLDHGTGTFALKLTMHVGCCLIIQPGYQAETFMANIERWRITDVMLGSALLHNILIDTSLMSRYDVSSLLNIMSIGSKIQSVPIVRQFIDKYARRSVRQTYGSTETGFICYVARDRCRQDTECAGQLLPNVEVRLVDGASGHEVTQHNVVGEMYVRSPTVSPGYFGPAAPKSDDNFMKDGFYKTGDLARITSDHNLLIEGRILERLCLGDGWKVLPQELEAVVQQHPAIAECCVIGMPHPTELGNHAPRAYVTLKADCRHVHANDIRRFVDERVSPPKRLIGGVYIVQEFPRISIGKVDKKKLKLIDVHNHLVGGQDQNTDVKENCLIV